MSKTLTEEQQRLLQRVHQAKEQQAKQSRPWTAGTGKTAKTKGVSLDPHVPQKKP
jgi:hypothetical protein